MKKIKAIMAAGVLSLTLLSAACGDNGGNPNAGGFTYYDEILSINEDYNNDLFYLNSLEFHVADPSVIYIGEGDQKGYFYAYGTSDDIDIHGYQSWRSKDLTHWESMGIAYKPDFTVTWAYANYWAPEVIYEPDDGLYYMFYSAQPWAKKGENYYMSVAYSENPQGPFVSPDKRYDGNGEMLSASKALFNVSRGENMKIDQSIARISAIDISPFKDPETGDRYIYFSYFDSFSRSEIFGMKMKDWFTPDWSTLKQITAMGFLTVEGGQNNDTSQKIAEGTINEGPFMYYRDGIYYLTFSVYGFTDEKYQVRQALGDSPLGIFTKRKVEEGGAVISTNPMWDHITSAGHHSFVDVGDELFIAYHTFYNRNDVSDGRALAVDKIEFIDGTDGTPLMRTNGPTYSLQPLPELVSGYKNIARSAEITSNNTAEGSDVKYLNDGQIKYQYQDSAVEYEANPGKAVITLNWDGFKTARAVMIYNSYEYLSTFISIDSVEFRYLCGDKGATSTVKIEKLAFDWDWHKDPFDEMRPGGAAIAEFADLPIDKMTVTLRSADADSRICIPEIVVLGKDTPVAKVTHFENYSYNNPQHGTPLLVFESLNFGQIGGLKTGYGYDLSHDDGTADAYITGNWCTDQIVYFNNVYDTKFYVEAKMTVTEAAAYMYGNSEHDPYPKFGLLVAAPENAIFYYVGSNANFTQKSVGFGQRKMDNSDWDWDATQQNFDAPSISFTNGNYVTLAIARDGADFYLLLDGALVLHYDSFLVFDADKKAAVGFRAFSTAWTITDYTATADPVAVDSKIAQIQAAG